jgi:hypothetical protein
METQMGENHIILSHISKITFIGSTNFLILQLQLEGGSNTLFTAPTWRKLQLHDLLATTGRRLQPPSLQAPT